MFWFTQLLAATLVVIAAADEDSLCDPTESTFEKCVINGSHTLFARHFDLLNGTIVIKDDTRIFMPGPFRITITALRGLSIGMNVNVAAGGNVTLAANDGVLEVVDNTTFETEGVLPARAFGVMAVGKRTNVSAHNGTVSLTGHGGVHLRNTNVSADIGVVSLTGHGGVHLRNTLISGGEQFGCNIHGLDVYVEDNSEIACGRLDIATYQSDSGGGAHVVVNESSVLRARMRQGGQIVVSGAVVFLNRSASVIAERGSVWLGQFSSGYQGSASERSGEDSACNAVTLDGARVSVNTSVLYIRCPKGVVRLKGGMRLHTSRSFGGDTATIDIAANTLNVTGAVLIAQKVSVVSQIINVARDAFFMAEKVDVEGDTGSLCFACQLPGLGTKSTTLTIRHQGDDVTLGAPNVSWHLEKLDVFAKITSQTVRLTDNFNISTQDTSCHNKQIDDSDADDFDSIASQLNVTFDLLIKTGGKLSVGNNVYLRGGSIALMTKSDSPSDSLRVGASTTLDASGLGCPRGSGSSPGLTKLQALPTSPEGGDTVQVPFTGGASHFGVGGHGAIYGHMRVRGCGGMSPETPCTDQASAVDLPQDTYPTIGASGGGWPCESILKDTHVGAPGKDDEITCGAVEDLSGSGGGLIWLYSGSELSFGKSVKVLADGHAGTTVNASLPGNLSIKVPTGGGAGGQVLLRALSLSLDDKAAAPVISARGGNAACVPSDLVADKDPKGFVAGAGGGGFVGFSGVSEDAAAEVGERFNANVNVRGGSLADCVAEEPEFPAEGHYRANGTGGLAVSLPSCEAGGAGLFCMSCEVGRWSLGNAQTCEECANKVGFSEYTERERENSPECDFRCTPGVPQKQGNPECLNWLSFIWTFLGGVWGIGPLLVLLLMLLLCLLLRHIRTGRRKTHGLLGETVFRRQTPGRRRSDPASMSGQRSGVANEDVPATFASELLPFHVCRIFLAGHNSWGSPWSLDGALPVALEPFVLEQSWDILGATANSSCAVPHREPVVERLFRAGLYPPLAAVFMAHRRRQRARHLAEVVGHFSEGGHSGRPIMWKPIRARDPSGKSTGEIIAILGCDSGATLGYIDFFDRSRSRLDFAGPDLRSEVRLLVAHGDGTHAEPFALDIEDPLVMHLAQSGLGNVAVYTVVSTFNKIARLMPAEELELGLEAPMLLHLRKAVTNCSEKLGLQNCVRVVTLQKPHLHVGSPLQSMHEGASSTRQPMRSISQSGSYSPTASFTANAAPNSSEVLYSRKTDFRIGLAFTDNSQWTVVECSILEGPDSITSYQAMWETGGNRQQQQQQQQLDTSTGTEALFGSASPRPPSTLLSSPMIPGSLGEHLAWQPPQGSELPQEARSLDQSGGRQPGCCGGMQSGFRKFCRALIWSRRGARAPAGILVLLMALLVADLFNFCLKGFMCFKLSPWATTVWLLLPPLAQTLAVVLGPIYLVVEDPRLGRLYASVTLFGMANAIVLYVVLTHWYREEAWMFNMAEVIMSCILKLALFWVANCHARNLEAANDLSFIEAPNARFIDEIVSLSAGTGETSAWQPGEVETRHLHGSLVDSQPSWATSPQSPASRGPRSAPHSLGSGRTQGGRVDGTSEPPTAPPAFASRDPPPVPFSSPPAASHRRQAELPSPF